jgi:glycerol-3-phosphate dehydrogenase (NAD(P)+)
MMLRVAVIGAGSWGTALAEVAARAGHEVRLWSRNAEVIRSINEAHVNSQYLKDAKLSDSVVATGEFFEAVTDAALAVLATPSHTTRTILTSIKPLLKSDALLVGAAKGIEIETGRRMSQLAQEILGSQILDRYVCLTGPSFAKEVVSRHPTAVVAASCEPASSRIVQSALSFDNLRIYTNDDLVGAELGGAVKNVIAIASGMVAGLGFGSNSVAALITRGLAEMNRLALAQGAKPETMMGLAGLGDLVLTCTGSLSRNRYVGIELGRGRRLDEICGSMQEVAEGIKTTLAVKQMAERTGIEAPITSQVHAVLYESKSPADAAAALMKRPLKEEFQEFE